MGTPLGPKYIPYTYMDPLGKLPSAYAFGKIQYPYLLEGGYKGRYRVSLSIYPKESV